MERSLETARPVVLEALAQACSQNADILKPAEQKLQQWETEPGFYSILTVNMVLFSSLNRLANAQFVLSILKFLSFFSFFQYIACFKKKKNVIHYFFSVIMLLQKGILFLPHSPSNYYSHCCRSPTSCPPPFSSLSSRP